MDECQTTSEDEGQRRRCFALVINGGNWFVSGAPAPRWDVEDLAAVKRVKIREFEVVAMGTCSWTARKPS